MTAKFSEGGDADGSDVNVDVDLTQLMAPVARNEISLVTLFSSTQGLNPIGICRSHHIVVFDDELLSGSI